MRLPRAIRWTVGDAMDRVRLMQRQLIGFALFATVVVGGGIGATWLMVERGSALTTERQGPWTLWTAAGRADADPYTRAHFVRNRVLPVSAAIASRYEAGEDSGGRALHSSCDYLITGPEPASYWSLAVFDQRGRIVRNDAERYSFNKDTALRAEAGRLSISLSRNARPGNWLPTGGAGPLRLVLRIEPAPGGTGGPADAMTTPLPEIRRVAC